MLHFLKIFTYTIACQKIIIHENTKYISEAKII